MWGLTRNPWNLDYSPGGSSGGSGAATDSPDRRSDGACARRTSTARQTGQLRTRSRRFVAPGAWVTLRRSSLMLVPPG
ncbi:amidase family protein [Streptosporangium sp. NPDC002607]